MFKRTGSGWWWLLVVLWIGIIFNFSLQDQGQSAQQSSRMLEIVEPLLERIEGMLGRELIPDALLHWMVRKAAHVTLYLILGVLMHTAIRYSGISAGQAIWMGLGLIILVAGTDEFLQTLIPGRSGQWRDVFLDSLSGLAGIGVSIGIGYVGRWLRPKLQPRE